MPTGKFLMTSLHVICGLGLPNQKFWLRLQIGDCLKTFFEDLFFREHLWLCPWSLALASSIPVLGLGRFCPRKGCPWPWPRIFFCVLGLEPCVLDSTSGPQVLENCPVLGSSTALFLELLKFCRLPEKNFGRHLLLENA